MDFENVDRLRLAMASREPCEVCEGTEWRSFGSEIDGKPTRLVLGAEWPDGTPVADYGFEVIAIACVQRGTVRLMVADLLALIDLKPESDAEDDEEGAS